jgi:hypothetical protein
MTNFLGPYFVRINYHYILGPHTMTIPTNVWSPDGGVGTFATWDDGAAAADTMITELVTLMLPFFDVNTQFDNWTVFQWDAPNLEPIPRVAGAFTSLVGTASDGKWSAAVEQIITARTTNFGIAKLDFLDADSKNNFNPINAASGALLTLMAAWGALINGWRGRDNGRPDVFLKMTTNLNQKLRKTYRLD